jgi:hypothetical protein
MTRILSIFFFVGTLLMAATTINAQCLDWVSPSPTTGYTNFNDQFGGAPCDDGTGCPVFQITGFEVWAAEAYIVNNFIAGGSYTFNICEGPGSGTWAPDFTIISPSGAVDAFGTDGDGCSITWTASESGSYLIVINDAANCGGGPNQGTDNGFPTLTCNGNAPCPAFVCEPGTMTTTGSTVVCINGTFEVTSIESETPAGGGFGWFFSNGQGGTGALGGDFLLSGSDTTEIFDNDLNGVLSANMFPVFEGLWSVRAAVYEDVTNPFGTICEIGTDSLVIDFIDEEVTLTVVDNGDNTATANASGGTMPYAYEWSDGQTTQTATGLMMADYTVTVTDAIGCTVVGSVSIGFVCDAGDMITTGEVIVCPDGTFTVTTVDNNPPPTAGGFGWLFSNSAGGTGALGGDFVLFGVDTTETYDNDLNGLLSANLLPVFEGLWSVRAAIFEDQNDAFNTICNLSEDSLLVNFVESPIIDNVTDNGDNTATVNASGGLMPYTYEWSDGQTTQTATGLMPGIYTVTVTDDNGCIAEGEVSVALPCFAGEMITNGEVTVCPGDTFAITTIDNNPPLPSGGFGWFFSNSPGGTGALGGDFILTGVDTAEVYDNDLNGLLSANLLPVFEGVWSIRAAIVDDITDPFNTICSLSEDSLLVDFVQSPVIDNVVDNGDNTATVNASGGLMPYTYEWSDGQTTQTATGLMEGEYTVTVTDANGCTAEGLVNVGLVCDAGEMITVGEVTVCPDGTYTITTINNGPAPPSGGFGWFFSNNPGGTGALGGDFVLFGVDTTETYDNDLNGLLSANMLPVFEGQWSIRAAIFEDENDAFNTICDLSEDSLLVNFVASPIIDGIVDNGDASATVTASGGLMPYTYEWSDGQTTQTAVGLPEGNYTVTVTDANGCTAEGSVTVQAPCNAGEMTTTGETVVCTDGTFEVIAEGDDPAPAGGGFGWVFSNGQGGTGALDADFILTGVSTSEEYDNDLNGVLSDNMFPVFEGIWSVRAAIYEDGMDPFNTICSLSADSLVVNFTGSPVIDDITDNGDNSATVTASGGTPPYSYEWSDGQTTETATDLPTGDYTVIVTDANGCVIEGMVSVISTGIRELVGLATIQTHPNPTSGLLNLQIEMDQATTIELRLVDVTGRSLITQTYSNTATLAQVFDLSQFQNGVYLLQITTEKGTAAQKIVLQK